MRWIDKGREPAALAKWKRENPECRYRELPTDVKDMVREALLAEQGCLCAYTMRRIDGKSCHIEHFHPQSASPDETLAYGNLLACWPLPGRVGPAPCGAEYKADSTADICSPTSRSDVEGQFLFGLDGKVIGVSEKAARTIRVLNLNEAGLVSERRRAMLGALRIGDPRHAIVKPLSAKEARRLAETMTKKDAAGRLAPFCLAVSQCLVKYAERREKRAARMKGRQRP